MKTLVLATSNTHKLQEIKTMLKGFKVLSLKDIGFTDEIIEDGKTTADNAKIKANAVLQYCLKKNHDYGVIADDSGLFVNALKGAPGVKSARYAADHDDEANRKKLLRALKKHSDRTAYYECTICYADESDMKLFVGRTYGEITTSKIGNEDFCYDCLFYSDDLKKTFGESTEAEKDSVSHRGRAIEKLKEWLTKDNPHFDMHIEFNETKD